MKEGATKSKKGRGPDKRDYSWHRMWRQPAKAQELASSKTSLATTSGGRFTSLKMRALRSRQIAQMTSNTSDLAVLAGTPTRLERDANHAGSEGRGEGCQASGRSEAMPNLSATLSQRDRDQGHSTRRCSAVSKLCRGGRSRSSANA